MSNLMEYKGLAAKVSFDAQDKTFYGEVIGARTYLSFAGKSAAALEKSFHSVVDEYIRFCKDQDITPEKTWKGKVTFRPRSDELRHRIWVQATANNMSVNEWMNTVIESAVAGHA
jgi:predicted HicB family RNase H-like nuclease